MDASFEPRLVKTTAAVIALAASIEMVTVAGDTVVLVPKQAAWRYLDNGSDQQTAWKELWYDDDAWGFGRAELGYGDDLDGRPETTVINGGPDPNNRYITTYFRRFFYVEAAAIQKLTVKLLRDDGGIVYLNGVEAFRSGMPGGPVNFLTLASEPGASGPDETAYFSSSINPQFLFNGINLVAVEIHQRLPNSSDVSFDFELVANEGSEPPPATLIRGPYLQSGTVSSVVVRWRTDRAVESKVLFGSSPQQLLPLAVDPTPTTEHIVTLNELQPDTRYYYAVASDSGILAGGADYFFVTAPAAPKPTRIWAIGDSGTASAGVTDWQAVRDAYTAYSGNRETDVWLMLGDNAYYYGTDSEYQTAVFESYAALLRKWVLWSTIGNHETYPPLVGEPVSYFDNFSFPTAGEAGGEPSGTENYYSFNYSDIHFVCLDSELAANSPGSPMLAWLEADLAANTRPWTIAFFHSPPYNFGTHNSDNPGDTSGHLVQMRENIVPVLESYGVDLVLSGHSHSYERSYLLNGHYGYSSSLLPEMIKDSGDGRIDGNGAYRKQASGPDAQGAIYVVCGSSGWVTGDTVLPSYQHPAMFIKLKELGSMVVDVDGNRLDAKFLRETGDIDDHFTILKGNSTGDAIRIATFHVSQGVVTARWNSIAGRRYRVQRTERLENPDWQPASAHIEATGATTAWSGRAIPGLNESYYRVEQLD